MVSIVSQFVPDNDENLEHIRHKMPLQPTTSDYDDLPARWYRINVLFIPMLIALVDYLVHADAHSGTPGERELSAGRWRNLQIYLMLGTLVKDNEMPEGENPFCEMVAACLASGGLNDTMRGVNEDLGYGGDSATKYPTAPASRINVVYDCDPDNLYGAIKQMVDLFNRLCSDFLENAVALTNWAQKAEYAIASIPILGSLPFDEMIGFISVAVENIQENYQGSYNVGLRNEYICDLWCLAMQGCEINLYTIANYFAVQFWEELIDITWLDLIEYLLEGTFSGTEMVHAIHTVLAFSLAAGGAFLGISANLFTALMKSFYNDPDPDWNVLCEPCQTGADVLFLFADSDYGFTILPDRLGGWESGEGFTLYGTPETSTTGCGIRKVFAGLYDVTKVKVEFELRWGSQSTVTRPHAVIVRNGEESESKVVPLQGDKGRVYTKTIEIIPEFQSDSVECWARAGGSGTGSYVKIRKLHLWFAGDLPAEFEGI